MRIVGIGYKKSSGKDQFASFMHTFIRCAQPGLCIKRVSFADKLKNISCQLYGWAGLQNGPFYERYRDKKEVALPLIGKSPRQIWIEVGNKLREVYEETWIDYALRGIDADIIIISDVRFRNEARRIKNQGGMLIRIDRPDITQGTDPAEVELDAWDNWDLIVDNAGDLTYLNSIAESLSRKLINDIQAANS